MRDESSKGKIRIVIELKKGVDEKFVSIPVNITTINQLCDVNLQNENDVADWLNNTQVKYETINNSEEMAKSRIGNVFL